LCLVPFQRFPRRNEDAADVAAVKQDQSLDEKGQYDESVDIYSFALICYELVTGVQVWDGLSEVDIPIKVCQGERPALPNSVDARWRTVIEACWSQKPKKRWSAAEIVYFIQFLVLKDDQTDTCKIAKMSTTADHLADLTPNQARSLVSGRLPELVGNFRSAEWVERNGEWVVCKVSRLSGIKRSSVEKLVRYSTIDHPNVIRVVGTCFEPSHCMFTEYMGQDLDSFWHRRSDVELGHPPGLGRWIALNIAQGLVAFHESNPHPTIIRNLTVNPQLLCLTKLCKSSAWQVQHHVNMLPVVCKPAAVWVNGNVRSVKICDLPSEFHEDAVRGSMNGSLRWTAPEVSETSHSLGHMSVPSFLLSCTKRGCAGVFCSAAGARGMGCGMQAQRECGYLQLCHDLL
jgi:serine/threonine protein kinase